MTYASLTTKKSKVDFVRTQILTSNKWATRALLAVYANQTADEQASKDTTHHNGKGFTGSDAEFFSKMAERAKVGAFLSEKQMACIRKGMKKYAAQLVNQVEAKA